MMFENLIMYFGLNKRVLQHTEHGVLKEMMLTLVSICYEIVMKYDSFRYYYEFSERSQRVT